MARIFRFFAATVLLAGSGACAGAPREEVALEIGDRVRFLAPGYNPAWQLGEVGGDGECTSVMVPDSWERPRRMEIVPVDSIRQMQVSSRSAGQVHAAAGLAGNEEWTDVDIRAVHARYGGCSPMP